MKLMQAAFHQGETLSPWSHYMKAYSFELGGSVAACKIPATEELFTHHNQRQAAYRD
jgi:hypothetical protein